MNAVSRCRNTFIWNKTFIQHFIGFTGKLGLFTGKDSDKLGIGIILAPKPENMKGYATHGEAMPIDDIACNYYDILKTANEFGMEMPNYRALESILNR